MVEGPGHASAQHIAAVLDSARNLIGQVPDTTTRYADADLPVLLQELLQLRAAAEGAALAVLIEADTRGLPTGPASTATNLARWLRQVAETVDVPVTAGEAGTWAHLSAECRRGDNTVLAQACTSGRVPVATGAVLAKELRVIRSQVPAHLWDTCVEAFTGYAAGGASPKELRRARDMVVTQYGEAGWIETQQREAHQRRAFTRFTPNGPGTAKATIVLDTDSVALVEAAIGALSAPRPEPDGTPDARTPGQRRADALVEACAMVARQQRVPAEQAGIGNGLPHVIVTMDFEQLRNACGYGLTVDGQPISPTTVRQWACDARITPMVLGSRSEPLDVGRTARLATPAQVQALRQRDKGCTFPNCDRPPSWCDAHHIIHWLDYGPTDLDNLALLCQRHHTIVHRDGYTATVTAHGVHWYLPAHRQPA